MLGVYGDQLVKVPAQLIIVALLESKKQKVDEIEEYLDSKNMKRG